MLSALLLTTTSLGAAATGADAANLPRLDVPPRTGFPLSATPKYKVSGFKLRAQPYFARASYILKLLERIDLGTIESEFEGGSFNVRRTGSRLRSNEQSGTVELGDAVTRVTIDIDHSIRPRTGTGVWHRWMVIIPRRSITGGFVWGTVWRRTNRRRWIYKKFV